MKEFSTTVLIIEDDEWVAEQHTRTLAGAGFTVRRASDGIAGMEVIDEYHPHVVVLDIFLPGPNALALLHEIQSHADLASLPVVICSNSSVNVSPDILKAYGVTAVLDKGDMTPNDLIAAVKRTLP